MVTKKTNKKIQAGAKVASGVGTAGKLAKSAKIVKAGSKVATVAKYAGVAGAVIGGAYLVEKAAEKLGVRGGAGFIGKRKTTKGKHRKGKVPKTVKKWAHRITNRRKQEEKIIKDLFGNDGGKVIKKPKKTYSSGVITQAEAIKALRS